MSLLRLNLIVACNDADGSPEIVPVTVLCTQEQYDKGAHYAAAREFVENQGIQNAVWAADQNDAAQATLQCVTEMWDDAPEVTISDETED